MITQPGVFHAPQFGIPRRDQKVQQVNERKQMSPKQLEELAKLIHECNRRDLQGVIRK